MSPSAIGPALTLCLLAFVSLLGLDVELHTLREDDLRAVVHRARLAAHVRLPRVRSSLSSTAGQLLATEGATDLGAARACVHVRDAGVGAHRREPPFRRQQVAREDAA